MEISEAIEALLKLPKAEFDDFYESLPARTKLLIESRFVDFRDIMAKWYIFRETN